MLQFLYNDNRTGISVERNTYGFCNTACPGGLLVGPSDVGGTCPSGVETINKEAVDHCCCGSSSCCWASCTDMVLPQNCLPPGAEWEYNYKGYFEAVQAISGQITTSTVAPSGKLLCRVTHTHDHQQVRNSTPDDEIHLCSFQTVQAYEMS